MSEMSAEDATSNYVEAMRIEQLQPGAKRYVCIAGKGVALFNVEGAVYAIEDSCAHAGASLAVGTLDGHWVACRAHGMRFDVRTGKSRASAAFGVKAYPVRLADGKVFVAVE